MANILLLEPDKVLARTYSKALEYAGYTVTCAWTAQDAIDAADSSQPDVVILELQLLGHDGVEFLHEFCSYPEWQSIPIVVITHLPEAASFDMQAILGRDFGVHVCIYKPHATLARILRVVSELVAA